MVYCRTLPDLTFPVTENSYLQTPSPLWNSVEICCSEWSAIWETGSNSAQTKPVTCGVPQGSLLGPRLLTYYINDFSNSITADNLELYADDTTLYFIANNVDALVDGLTRAISEISLRCGNNKLTIHAGKFEAMIITHRAFCGPIRPIELRDKILDVVNKTRCLRVIIDSQLSWNSHL